jgi:poly(3-hydroxybutyrate) depolymerase
MAMLGCGEDQAGGAPSTAAGATSGSGAASSGQGGSAGGGASSSGSGAGTTVGSGGSNGSGGANGSGGSGGSGAAGGSAASTGCGQTGAATGVNNETIQAAGKQRSYILSVPSGYDPDTPYPLVFAWHGRGGDGALARLYFGVEGASAAAALFVYPDGLPVMGGATGWDLTNGGDDVQLFDAILAAVSQSHCVDENRVFSTGHSFGGYMSNTLGCARPGPLRAIAPVAGGGPFFGCDTSDQVAVWLTHGTGDDVVNISEGVGSRDHWQSANGCAMTSAAVTPSPCVAYDGCAAGMALHWCEHSGMHEWPPFAADGIWSFFAAL